MCSKSFPTPGDLKSHMYVHTGSWPFKCDVCHRGFSKQTNLRNHMQMHNSNNNSNSNSEKRPGDVVKPSKNLSPVLSDYLIGLSKQNNNLDEKKDKESAAVKLFRPINF